MKKTTFIFLISLFVLPVTVMAEELKLDLPAEPKRIMVVPFENETGDSSLDWVGWGLQDSMTLDLLYLKGFEAMTLFDSHQRITFTLPYAIREWYFRNAKKIDRDELLRNSSFPYQFLRQLWVGKYQGNPENMTVQISVLNVSSGRVLATKIVKAPLSGLLKESSKAVLELARELGVAVSKAEKDRVLSPKTSSVDAWRLNAEGFLYENEYSESSLSADADKGKLNDLFENWRKALKESVAADPNYAEAWINLSRLNYHYANKQHENTHDLIEKALTIKPFLIHANIGMADVFVNPENSKDRFYYLKKTVELNPSLSIYTDYLLNFIRNTQGKKEALQLEFRLLKSASPAIRSIAIRHLQQTGDKKTIIPAFAELVKDPDRDVRGISVNALGQAGGRAAVPALIQALNDPDRIVRSAAASALKATCDKTAIPSLIKTLKDPEIGRDAFSILAGIADKTVIPVMLEALKDHEKHVRAGGAIVLGAVGDKSAVPALIEALKDSDKDVRWNSASALGSIGDRTAVPYLVQALKDPNEDVGRSAMFALGKIGDPSAVPSLIEILQTDVDKSWFFAIGALKRIGDKSAVPALMEIVKNSSQYAHNKRTAALEALAIIGDKRALPMILEALKDKDTESSVRFILVGALGKINDEAAVPVLIETLKDPSWGVGETAAYALVKIRGNRAVMSLIESLKNPNEYMRRHAAYALGEIGEKAAVPGLIEALKDQSESVRSSAVEALGKIGDTQAVPALVEVFRRYKNFGTAMALGRMGDRTGLPVLLKELENRGVWFKDKVAVKIIAESGETSALYKVFDKSSGMNLFIFNQVRKNLWFPESFDVLIKSNDPFVKSAGYYLMALKAREEGRYKDQIGLINNALKQVDSEDKTAFTVLCLWLMTHAELKLDKQKDALETIKKAEELLGYISKEEWMQYQELFEEYTLFLKGEVNSANKDNKTAVKAYEEALEHVEKNKKDYTIEMGEYAPRLEAMVQTSLGALQIKMGKENLEKAVETGRNYQANDSVEMENEEKRYMELSRQKIAEGNYEEAQKLIEELNLRRTNYINRRTRINLADPAKQATIDEYRKKQDEIESITRKIETLALTKKDDKAGAGGPSQGEDEIKRLETEKNNKRRELQVYLTGLKKTHPDIAALIGAKPIELTTIQEQLPEDTTILQYLMLPDKLVVFVIKKAGIDIVETTVKKTELKDRVESLRKAIYAKTKGKDSKRITPLSTEVYGLLIKPLEDARKLNGIKVLGIAPNGFLHQLPFGALKDGQDRYLIDQYTLFYMNSTSLLGVAMERGRQTAKGENSLLALSNPDGSLPAADVEVKDISTFFTKKHIYSRKEATKSIIQTGKKDYSILHLSTHGIFDPLDSTRSHLVMADSNLTIEDIWGLPLKGVRLTVLSACETGLGEVLSGDDVVSLENAFIYAGSPTVVATLWQVADQSTAELMTLFYKNLTKGESKAEALTEAQRELKSKYDHPFFWAAFTLRGEWR